MQFQNVHTKYVNININSNSNTCVYKYEILYQDHFKYQQQIITVDIHWRVKTRGETRCSGGVSV